MRHIGREGRVYAVGCCMVLRKADVLTRFPQLEPFYSAAGDWINTGNSLIADPNGKVLAGPLDKEEGILYADIDLKMLRGTRWNLDVAGHYARPDAFHLTVRTASKPTLTLEERT